MDQNRPETAITMACTFTMGDKVTDKKLLDVNYVNVHDVPWPVKGTVRQRPLNAVSPFRKLKHHLVYSHVCISIIPIDRLSVVMHTLQV